MRLLAMKRIFNTATQRVGLSFVRFWDKQCPSTICFHQNKIPSFFITYYWDISEDEFPLSAILFVIISPEYLEYFFSSFNAQLNKAWQNNLIVLPEEKLEQEQHLSTQNARIQNSEVHKFSILLSFRSFFDAATTKRWQI